MIILKLKNLIKAIINTLVSKNKYFKILFKTLDDFRMATFR